VYVYPGSGGRVLTAKRRKKEQVIYLDIHYSKSLSELSPGGRGILSFFHPPGHWYGDKGLYFCFLVGAVVFF
jgi:hypothetical protein